MNCILYPVHILTKSQCMLTNRKKELATRKQGEFMIKSTWLSSSTSFFLSSITLKFVFLYFPSIPYFFPHFFEIFSHSSFRDGRTNAKQQQKIQQHFSFNMSLVSWGFLIQKKTLHVLNVTYFMLNIWIYVHTVCKEAILSST